MFDSYILCGTPRTGSTLLCKMLSATRVAGHPDSYYGGRFIAEWAADWQLPPLTGTNQKEFHSAYLAAAIRAGRGNTGVFGLRLMRENLQEFSDIIGLLYPGQASDAVRFAKVFGKVLYIHLYRADKLAQAISYIKAQQSGLWHVAPDGTELERLAAPQEPHYDFQRIRQEVLRLETQDAAWNTWFAAQRIEPLRASYDSLAVNPAATLGDIVTALGLEAPVIDSVKPEVMKLADETSLDWMHRYRKDLSAAG